MGRPRINGICSECDKQATSKGLCAYHYNKKRLEENPGVAKAGLRGHPYYHLWFERKQSNILSEAWLDFKIFINDVGIKPEGNYLLVRLRDAPYGKDNFKWQEHLKRKKDEPRKQWWARKREARKSAIPSMESDRSLRRQFGIDLNKYNKMLQAQNGVCAICGNKETTFDARNGSLKRLSVDHCHTTNKIRELLCWRCNGTIGKVNENVELLQKMIAYLIKHKEN